MHKRLES